MATTPRNREGVRIDSHLALFAPGAWVETTVPAPLYLFEFFGGTLRTNYEMDADGHVRQREDFEQVRSLRYANGLRCEVRVEGSRVEGLPTQYDVDYLLALFRICDAGGVAADGTLVDPSYRGISLAAGRTESPSGPQVEAVKRALRRWAHVRISTSTELDFNRLAEAVAAGRELPVLPGAALTQREFEATHHVLDYQVETEARDAVRRDNIRLLRIDPVWLAQAMTGITSWIDVDAHNRLTSATAKRLYQILAVRAARGAQAPHLWSMAELRDELGIRPDQKPARIVATLRAALEALREVAILRSFEVYSAARGEYAFSLTPGERLVASGLLRGLGGADDNRARAVLWHLRRYGVPLETARAYLYSRPTQALAALRRACFLQLERGGRDGARVVRDWSSWLARTIEAEHGFDDPEFLDWLDRSAAHALAPDAAIPLVSSQAAPLAPLVAESVVKPRSAPRRAGFRAALDVELASTGDLVVKVRLDAASAHEALGFVEGTLEFSDALRLLDARMHHRAAGAWNLEMPGVLRFAAMPAGDAPLDVLLELRFAAARPLAPGDLQLRIERLASAGEFRDLTPLLATSAAPLPTS